MLPSPEAPGALCVAAASGLRAAGASRATPHQARPGGRAHGRRAAQQRVPKQTAPVLGIGRRHRPGRQDEAVEVLRRERVQDRRLEPLGVAAGSGRAPSNCRGLGHCLATTRQRDRRPPAVLLGPPQEPRHGHEPNELDRPGVPIRGRLPAGARARGPRQVVEEFGYRALAEAAALILPALTPFLGRVVRDLAVRARQPGERPDPGHHPVGVVPPPPVASQAPPAWRWARRSTSRAAAPIADVVTSRCARGSHAWLSQPCWLTITSGPKAAATGARMASTAPSQASGPVSGSSGTLIAVPAASPSPSSSMNPVPGNSVRPVSWSEIVITCGSPAWIVWTPSPWWTSRSR